jgi:hypothetical protein
LSPFAFHFTEKGLDTPSLSYLSRLDNPFISSPAEFISDGAVVVRPFLLIAYSCTSTCAILAEQQTAVVASRKKLITDLVFVAIELCTWSCHEHQG